MPGVTHYPILTDGLNAHQALALACYQGLGHPTWMAKDPDDFITQCDFTGRCPTCDSSDIGPAYEPADVCQNCGVKQIGLPLGTFCSRACQLQAEYAEAIRSPSSTDQVAAEVEAPAPKSQPENLGAVHGAQGDLAPTTNHTENR